MRGDQTDWTHRGGTTLTGASILAGAVAVVLASLAVRLTPAGRAGLVSSATASLAVLVVALVALAALAAGAFRGISRHGAGGRVDLCAGLGAAALGLAATFLVGGGWSPSWAGALVASVSLLTALAAVTLGGSDDKDAPDLAGANASGYPAGYFADQTPTLRTYAPPPAPRPLFESVPREMEQLPPLFGDDPLYKVPQPRRVRLFIHPKGDGTPVECEDACALDETRLRFAVCDGTGGSDVPRPWAGLLAQRWVGTPILEVPDAELFGAWLEPARQSFARWLREVWLPTLNERNQRIGALPLPPGRADEIAARGASATLLGVQLAHGGQGLSWRALAMGDTCLLVFEPGADGQFALAEGFPLARAGDFNDRPPSITSRDADMRPLMPFLRAAEGQCSADAVMLLATDALAKWICRQVEDGTDAWRALLTMESAEAFDRFVDGARTPAGTLEDDDTTLIAIAPRRIGAK